MNLLKRRLPISNEMVNNYSSKPSLLSRNMLSEKYFSIVFLFVLITASSHACTQKISWSIKRNLCVSLLSFYTNVKTQVKNLVAIELAYINTKHPDFTDISVISEIVAAGHVVSVCVCVCVFVRSLVWEFVVVVAVAAVVFVVAVCVLFDSYSSIIHCLFHRTHHGVHVFWITS